MVFSLCMGDRVYPGGCSWCKGAQVRWANPILSKNFHKDHLFSQPSLKSQWQYNTSREQWHFTGRNKNPRIHCFCLFALCTPGCSSSARPKSSPSCFSEFCFSQSQTHWNAFGCLCWCCLSEGLQGSEELQGLIPGKSSFWTWRAVQVKPRH